MYFVLKYFQTNGKSKLEKGDAKMGRKLLEITTLNGLTIDELIDLEEKYQKKSINLYSVCDYEI